MVARTLMGAAPHKWAFSVALEVASGLLLATDSAAVQLAAASGGALAFSKRLLSIATDMMDSAAREAGAGRRDTFVLAMSASTHILTLVRVLATTDGDAARAACKELGVYPALVSWLELTHRWAMTPPAGASGPSGGGLDGHGNAGAQDCAWPCCSPGSSSSGAGSPGPDDCDSRHLQAIYISNAFILDVVALGLRYNIVGLVFMLTTARSDGDASEPARARSVACDAQQGANGALAALLTPDPARFVAALGAVLDGDYPTSAEGRAAMDPAELRLSAMRSTSQQQDSAQQLVLLALGHVLVYSKAAAAAALQSGPLLHNLLRCCGRGCKNAVSACDTLVGLVCPAATLPFSVRVEGDGIRSIGSSDRLGGGACGNLAGRGTWDDSVGCAAALFHQCGDEGVKALCNSLVSFTAVVASIVSGAEPSGRGMLSCALLLALMAVPASGEAGAASALVAAARASPELLRVITGAICWYPSTCPSVVRSGGNPLHSAPLLLLAALSGATATAGAEGAALLQYAAASVSSDTLSMASVEGIWAHGFQGTAALARAIGGIARAGGAATKATLLRRSPGLASDLAELASCEATREEDALVEFKELPAGAHGRQLGARMKGDTCRITVALRDSARAALAALSGDSPGTGGGGAGGSSFPAPTLQEAGAARALAAAAALAHKQQAARQLCHRPMAPTRLRLRRKTRPRRPRLRRLRAACAARWSALAAASRSCAAAAASQACGTAAKNGE